MRRVAAFTLPPGLAARSAFTLVWLVLAVFFARCQEVLPAPNDRVARVDITPGTLRFVAFGDTARFAVAAISAAGDMVPAVVPRWQSLDSSIASVNTTGLVTALRNGGTSIVVTVGRRSDTASVQVQQVVVALQLAPAPDSILLRDTVRLSSITRDANGAIVIGPSIAWRSSAPAVATVDNSGLVRAIAAGEAEIEARADRASDTTRMRVAVRYRLFGIGFSAFTDGQDPNRGSVITETQLRERMRLIRPYTRWIRTFGSTAGLEASGRVAHELGLKVACGAWLARNAAANERELVALIGAVQRRECDLAIVGSETLLRGDLADSVLVRHIERVKREAPGVSVTTADVYDQFWRHPAVVAAVDVVFANYYPFWDGLPLDQAARMLHGLHSVTVSLAGGKPVYVSETGWPSCGLAQGDAVPSPANAALHFLNVASWARVHGIPYFYFSALDEEWKTRYEGAVGACWGILDKNGKVKPGFEAVFEDRTLPDNWTAPIPGGPGVPTLVFDHVPPRGSSENLRGRVLHVAPFGVGVAVYIRVRGAWWTKPYFTQPVTRVRPDGTWSTDITTGGVDAEATEVAAFLVPATYNPPLLGGAAALPVALSQHAIAQLIATRR